jgi:hypothetical protein
VKKVVFGLRTSPASDLTDGLHRDEMRGIIGCLSIRAACVYSAQWQWQWFREKCE